MKSLDKKWLPHGSFLRNVGILTGGTLFAQGIMVMAMPLLTRLYTPDDFGLLAVYASLLSIFSVVACLRYNIAIPIPHNDVDGFALLIISLVAAAIVSLFVALPIVFAPSASASLIGQPEMGPHLWMLPVGVFLAGSYDALQHWAFRKKRFWSVTFTRITRATAGTGVQVGIGAVAPSPFGLLFGHMLFSGLGLIGLGMDLIRKDRGCLRSISLRVSIANAKEQYRFPAFSVPEALMNTMSAELPIILIAAIALGEEAGFLMLVP
jgi:O-antigen/teichoic acid export membrane protein